MTLHIVSKAPTSHPALSECLNTATPGDTVLFIGDGCYAAHSTITTRNDVTLLALRDDTQARGIPKPAIELIGYDQFVELTCQYNPIQSWY